MKVYILFHETNTGDFDESDGYVEAVYSTKEAAEAAQLAAVRNAILEGRAVYWNPDTQEECEHWDDDWRVEEHDVIEKAPASKPLCFYKRSRMEIPRTVRGRPSYVWVEAFVLTDPTTGNEMQPYFRPRDAKAYAKAAGWQLVERQQ
jgi:hypothetical protein